MLTIYADGLPDAMYDGLEDAVQAGAQVMINRLEAASTYTGRREHPSHPGRHKTGALAESIWDQGEASESYRIRRTASGNLTADFGILDPPDEQGAMAQEFGTGAKGGAIAGGGSGGIQGMMIVQAGFNTVASQLNDRLAAKLTELGRTAEALRAYRRSGAAQNRVNPNVGRAPRGKA
jgi:hypothetical protein